MFNFRIIYTPEGNQIINTTLKTLYSTLSEYQINEYIETEKQLEIINRIEQKRKRETERKKKLMRNPFYKIACIFGIV